MIVENITMAELEQQDSHDPEVLYQKALCYMEGKGGVEKNEEKGARLMLRASNRGNYSAIQCMKQQMGPVTRLTLPNWCTWAEWGDLEAMVQVANYCITMRLPGTDGDINRYLTAAAARGYEDAVRFIRQNGFEEAEQWFRDSVRMAQQNHCDMVDDEQSALELRYEMARYAIETGDEENGLQQMISAVEDGHYGAMQTLKQLVGPVTSATLGDYAVCAALGDMDACVKIKEFCEKIKKPGDDEVTYSKPQKEDMGDRMADLAIAYAEGDKRSRSLARALHWKQMAIDTDPCVVTRRPRLVGIEERWSLSPNIVP